MRPGRVALVCFLLAALVGAASYARPEGVVLVGMSTTRGLGETTPAPEIRSELAAGPLYAEALWSGAHKIESGSGWLARGAVEVRLGPLGLGAAYSYRDGGTWTKSYPWARASLGNASVRLIVEHALGGYNRESKAELRSYARRGHFVVGFGAFAERHLQGTGYGANVLVGLHWNRMETTS